MIERNPEPAIGQVWRDADKRFQNNPRHFRIVQMDAFAVIVQTCRATDGSIEMGARRTRIRLDNLFQRNRYAFVKVATSPSNEPGL